MQSQETNAIVVPAIEEKNRHFTLSGVLEHRFLDMDAIPKNQYYKKTVAFSSRITMLGRSFFQGDAVRTRVDVMWPVRIDSVNHQKWLGPGEHTTLTIKV